MTGNPYAGHRGPLADRYDQLVIRYVDGPWHGALWTPANPAGVHSVLRVDGWDGSYRRHRIAHDGVWQYQWIPDSAVTP